MSNRCFDASTLTKLISDRAQAEHVRLQQKLQALPNPPKNFLRWRSNTNDKDASVIGDVNAGWGTTWTRGNTLLVPDVPCGCVEVIVPPPPPPVPVPTFRGIAQWAVDAGESVTLDSSCAAISVVTDLCGNLYVAGYYSQPMNVYSYTMEVSGTIQETIYGWLDSYSYPYSLFLIKYNSSGTVLSAASIIGVDPTPFAIAGTYLTIDAFDCITVCFRLANHVYYPIFPSLTPSQNVPYSNAAGRINPGAAIYGYINQAGTGGFGVVQYEGSTGSVRWATQAPTGIPFSICSNSIGDTMLCGTTNGNLQLFSATGTLVSDIVVTTLYGTLTGSDSGFLIQYDSSGIVQWAANQLGQDVVSYSLATDRHANVYVTGRFTNSIQFNSYIRLDSGSVVTYPFGTMTGTGSTDTFLVKYRVNGLCDWATGLLGSTSSGLAITVDSSSNLCLTGTFTTPLQLNDVSGVTFPNVNLTPFANLYSTDASAATFLARYTDEGKAVWATTQTGASTSLVTDQSNNVYLACTYAPSLILNNYTSVYNSTIQTSRYGILQTGTSAIAAYSSQGRVLWAASQGTTSVAHGIAIDPSQQLLLVGERGNQPLTVQSFTQIQTQLPLTIQQTLFGTLPGSSSNTYGFLAKYRTS